MSGQKFDTLTQNRISNKRFLIRLLIVLVVFFSAGVILNHWTSKVNKKPTKAEKERKLIESLNITLENNLWVPDGGDNITGWPRDIVPNIVHNILFQHHEITYVHMLSLLSVVKIQKPEQIIIHCDCDQIDENDEHWGRVLLEVNQTNQVTIIINKIKKPREIYGKKLRSGNQHASDVTRWRIMSEYGGIYIDNDVFVCQPLNRFFKYEFTLDWDAHQSLGSQVLIGNRNARFPKFVMKTYSAYDRRRWYFNAGELPTKAILHKYPQLVHRVQKQFGVDAVRVCAYFYTEYHETWQKDFYTFHMVARGNKIQWKRWCLKSSTHFMWNTEFTDDFLLSLATTFGEMVRFVLLEKKDQTETDAPE